MSCERCGSPSQGALCADCEQMDRVERNSEHRSDGGAVALNGPAEPERRQLEYVPIGDLTRHPDARDIRAETVEEIQERIDADEFNPAKPLRVFETPDGYVVADGNHRVEALRELNWTGAVPCVVEPGDDPDYAKIVEVAAKSNRDEDTFAQDDLFDHLDRIERLSDDHTQAEIAEVLGDDWGRSKVKQHVAVVSQVGTEVLDLARSHQNGRVPQDGTNVPQTNFTEGWFRTSGLYDLNRDRVERYALPDEDEPKHAQLRVMEWYINDQNGNASKSAVQREVEDIEAICDQLDRLEAELNPGVSDGEREELRNDIIAGTYTDDTLGSAIENANQGAKNRAEYGIDALAGLETVESSSVDCVVTDPPYGVKYDSHRDTDRPSFPDEEQDTAALLDDVFAELERVCTANAHLYVFFSMNRYKMVRDIAAKYFEVTPTPLIWAKNNHAPTRDAERGFEKMYAHQYEPVLVCRMPNGDSRRLNGGVCANVLNYGRPSGDGRYHDAQKPRALLSELITNSTGKRETVCDPFAGSGSTLLAAAAADRHYIGFEQDDSYADRFTRELREVAGDE